MKNLRNKNDLDTHGTSSVQSGTQTSHVGQETLKVPKPQYDPNEAAKKDKEMNEENKEEREEEMKLKKEKEEVTKAEERKDKEKQEKLAREQLKENEEKQSNVPVSQLDPAKFNNSASDPVHLEKSKEKVQKFEGISEPVEPKLPPKKPTDQENRESINKINQEQERRTEEEIATGGPKQTFNPLGDAEERKAATAVKKNKTVEK